MTFARFASLRFLSAPALLALGFVWAGAAFAQEPREGAALTPVEEYAKKVEEFTKSAPELNRKIAEAAKSIEASQDVAKARAEIEELRGVVSDLLGSVSDNSVLAQLGYKALDHARRKLQSLTTEGRFKPEEREFLQGQWRDLIRQTEKASDDLDGARKEFAELLTGLQAREDFIDELMQIRRAAEALRVIRDLTGDVRNASEKLKTLIGGIKPPGV